MRERRRDRVMAKLTMASCCQKRRGVSHKVVVVIEEGLR